MKYIIESNDVIDYTPKYAMLFGDGYMIQPLDDLDELNYDYINEHYGSLQDDAYKRGLKDGKAQSDRGCEGCRYSGTPKGDSPCFNCSNYYTNNWTAKQTDDEIKVGDVVTLKCSDKHSFVVTKVSDESVWGVDTNGSWNYWAINEVIKTDKHFDIDKILEAMKE